MYLNFFNLDERPFKLNSDHKFLFNSEGHSAALAMFKKLIRSDTENLCVLTGEIGSGKTTLSQAFMSTLGPGYLVAKIHQTQLSPNEFLQMLLLEFGINLFVNSKSELLEKLTEYLLEQHQAKKKMVLIVDEAQNLKTDVLQLVKTLSELRSIDGVPLLRIILIGQPEFSATLEASELSSLKRKIKLRYHLEAMLKEEIKSYISHRLKIAGPSHEVEFTADVIPLIYLYTGGRARLINVLFDHALLAAYVENKKTVNAGVVESAVEELQWVPFGMEPTGKIFKFTETKISNAYEFFIILSKNGSYVDEYLINKKRLHIGRHSDNDIRIKSDKISRQHAIIIYHENDFFIRDMNSKNGTYVDNKCIDMQQLTDGAIIEMGEYTLIFKAKNISVAKDDNNENINILDIPRQA